MKKILLVDAFGLIFRSYYAFFTRPLTNKSGENISAVHGFFNALFSLLKKEKPDFVLIALEGKGKCFRYEMYPEYKANRQATPEDLKEQIVKIADLINKMEMRKFSPVISESVPSFPYRPDNPTRIPPRRTKTPSRSCSPQL